MKTEIKAAPGCKKSQHSISSHAKKCRNHVQNRLYHEFCRQPFCIRNRKKDQMHDPAKRLLPRSRLPPLNALRAFDATARHLTVANGAAYLGDPAMVGNLVVSAPVGLSSRVLTRHIGEFLCACPDVQFRLIASNEDKEVYSPAVDLCLRYG